MYAYGLHRPVPVCLHPFLTRVACRLSKLAGGPYLIYSLLFKYADNYATLQNVIGFWIPDCSLISKPTSY